MSPTHLAAVVKLSGSHLFLLKMKKEKTWLKKPWKRTFRSVRYDALGLRWWGSCYQAEVKKCWLLKRCIGAQRFLSDLNWQHPKSIQKACDAQVCLIFGHHTRVSNARRLKWGKIKSKLKYGNWVNKSLNSLTLRQQP